MSVTRRFMTGPVGWLLVTALVPAPGSDVAAQEPPGSVVGAIYDSVSSAPLAGAQVYLWNTSISAVTDEAGRFRLDGVPTGTHRLVYVHDILLELGVSTGTLTIDMPADRGLTVELATPSGYTILKNTCLLEGVSPDSAVALGYVGDEESGLALPGARVHFTWLDQLGSPHTLEAITNSFGWYRFCQVPPDVPLGATASFLSKSAPRQEVTFEPGEQVWTRLLVADLVPGSVSGTLVDEERGWAVEDAEVTLRGTLHRAVSGSGGRFRFPSVMPGEYTLEVSHLAYGPRAGPVSVGSSMAVSVEVGLSVDPIELAPIVVTAESIVDLDGIVAGGRLITREEVEAVRHRARDLADILRLQHLSEVIVRRGPSGQVCVGITTGQVRLYKEQCSNAVFYLDNARISTSEMVMTLAPHDIDRIVVYRPVEAGNLFGLGAGNGVILVYTKSGQRRRRPSS